jgi:hypothetical protein
MGCVLRQKVQFMHIEEANSLQRAAGYISGFLGFAVESGSYNAAAFFPLSATYSSKLRI